MNWLQKIAMQIEAGNSRLKIKQVERFLAANGYMTRPQQGRNNHVIYYQPGNSQNISIPAGHRNINSGILFNIAQRMGISPRELLKRIQTF